ncbi:MAG: hypothetical protein EOO94_00110 [Pedobacter sp.]|nr:MAG: hypothetical protein EOO94_00110 [Pedobacter sp.]
MSRDAFLGGFGPHFLISLLADRWGVAFYLLLSAIGSVHKMVQPKPPVAMSSMEPSDDAALGHGRKRNRRNAIKPNSADAMALMEFSVQYQLNNVSIEPPEEEEPSKKPRESISDEESFRSGVGDDKIVSSTEPEPSSNSSNNISNSSSNTNSNNRVTYIDAQEVISGVPKLVDPVRIDEVLVTMVPFTSAPCTPIIPPKKIESELKDS